MMFQALFAASTLLCMFYFIVKTHRAAAQRLFVGGFFSAGLFVIVRPELSNRLAHAVGIGRGADLILYVSTLFLFFLSFNYYLRFRAAEERIASVVRELSLTRPIREQGAPPPIS